MNIPDESQKRKNTKSNFWKKTLDTRREKKIQLEGTWFFNTSLTIALSHLSLFLLVGHTFYFQQNLKAIFIEYCLKGTLYISGLSLMSTTLLNKKNEEVPVKNKKKMNTIKVLLGITLVIQAVFYSYSVDNDGIVNLNQHQIKISLFLYILSILLFGFFNYFNRREINYEDSQVESREEMIIESKKRNKTGGLNI